MSSISRKAALFQGPAGIPGPQGPAGTAGADGNAALVSESTAIVRTGNANAPAGVHRMAVPKGANLAAATTDAWPALQALLDTNTNNKFQVDCYLPVTSDPVFNPGDFNPMVYYSISKPLAIDDFNNGGVGFGNSTKVFRGAGRSKVGIMPTMLTPGNVGTQSWIGPLIISGACVTNLTPGYVVDNGVTCLIGHNVEFINYSQWDTGTIIGDESWTYEIEWNALTDFPGSYAYVLATCAGDFPFTGLAASSFQLARLNIGGFPCIQALLQTSGGNFFATLPFDLTPNTLERITFEYDASAHQIHLYHNGQQPVFGPITTGGSSPPAVTFTGTPSTNNIFEVDIESGGTTFQWKRGGGVVATGVPIGSLPSTVALSDGISVNFPSGSYSLGQTWTVVAAQPNVTVSGAFQQQTYEEFTGGGGARSGFPQTSQSIYPGVSYHMGRQALSRGIVRHGAPFTPTSADFTTCDANTAVTIDFANRGDQYRGGWNEWVIGRTGATSPSGSLRSNMPVWYFMNSGNYAFHYGVEISDMCLLNPQGMGIHHNASLHSETHDLFIHAFTGMRYDAFCYPIRIYNVDFGQGGDNGSGTGHKISIYLSQGSQSARIGPGMAVAGKPMWYVASTFQDVTHEPSLLTSCTEGFFLFTGSAGAGKLNAVSLDDENFVVKRWPILVASANAFELDGGFQEVGLHATNYVKVGHCPRVRVGGGIAWGGSSGAIFSGGTDANLGSPIKWEGVVYGAIDALTLIDSAHPIGVMTPDRELFGEQVINYATTADHTMTNTEALARHIDITGALTGNVNLIAAHNPGKWYEFKDSTTGGHTITFKGPTGAGVTVSGGSTKVYDNGTDMVLR